MGDTALPEQLRLAIEAVTAKRARRVLDHILEHGQVTTEELRDLYGYDHPPRAARDVRELGIPLETRRVKSSSGRNVGAYRFAPQGEVQGHKSGGRRTFSKEFRGQVIAESGERCRLCSTQYEARYLQIDHRVPYEVAGDTEADELAVQDFMALCGSCQRSKSWSCEACHNWKVERREANCRSCYWAFPEAYSHVALSPEARLVVVWSGDEVRDYERFARVSAAQSLTPQDALKAVVARIEG